MFKAAPVRFLLAALLILAFGFGLLILIPWYLRCRFQTLQIMSGKIIYQAGVLSKEHVEMQTATIRSIRVEQSLMQRLFNVGDIHFTSSGSSPEIIARSMPRPNVARELATSDFPI